MIAPYDPRDPSSPPAAGRSGGGLGGGVWKRFLGDFKRLGRIGGMAFGNAGRVSKIRLLTADSRPDIFPGSGQTSSSSGSSSSSASDGAGRKASKPRKK